MINQLIAHWFEGGGSESKETMRNEFILSTLAFVLFFSLSIPGLGHTKTMTISKNQSQGDHRETPLSMEQIQQGKALYQGRARCVHCHGNNALRRDLTDQELFSIIKFGVPGTSHIPYKHLLSDEEIWSIVHYQLHNY